VARPEKKVVTVEDIVYGRERSNNSVLKGPMAMQAFVEGLESIRLTTSIR
jgi:hypothetical protein